LARLALALVAVGQVPVVPGAVSTEPLLPICSRLLAVPSAGRCRVVALGAVEVAAWSPAQLRVRAPSPEDAPVMERRAQALKKELTIQLSSTVFSSSPTGAFSVGQSFCGACFGGACLGSCHVEAPLKGPVKRELWLSLQFQCDLLACCMWRLLRKLALCQVYFKHQTKS